MKLFRELLFLFSFMAAFTLTFTIGNIFVSFSDRILLFLQDSQWKQYGMVHLWNDTHSGIMIGSTLGIIWFIGLQFFKKNRKPW